MTVNGRTATPTSLMLDLNEIGLSQSRGDVDEPTRTGVSTNPVEGNIIARRVVDDDWIGKWSWLFLISAHTANLAV